MDPMPISVLMSRKATLRHVHSAEPDAPVVEPRARRERRPRAVRTRGALAAMLRRAAEAITPPPVCGDGRREVGHAA
ncbi:hypothetical protein [Cellulomonas sp. URHB0016]